MTRICPQSSINESISPNASMDVNVQGQSLSGAKELEVEKTNEEVEVQPVPDPLDETRIPRAGDDQSCRPKRKLRNISHCTSTSGHGVLIATRARQGLRSIVWS